MALISCSTRQIGRGEGPRGQSPSSPYCTALLHCCLGLCTAERRGSFVATAHDAVTNTAFRRRRCWHSSRASLAAKTPRPNVSRLRDGGPWCFKCWKQARRELPQQRPRAPRSRGPWSRRSGAALLQAPRHPPRLQLHQQQHLQQGRGRGLGWGGVTVHGGGRPGGGEEA